jgi:hypothetical protein
MGGALLNGVIQFLGNGIHDLTCILKYYPNSIKMNVAPKKRKPCSQTSRKSKENCRVFTYIESAVLSSFGCLDGVKFLFFGFGSGFNMGGHVAGSVFPFQGRIRCGSTVNAGGKLGTFLAPFTFINNRKAVTFVIAAALGGHENTLLTFSNSCTNHNRLPVLIFISFDISI